MENGAQRLDLQQEYITLVLTGGVFKGDGKVLYQMIEHNIQDKQLNFICSPAHYEPVAGAALLILDDLNEVERADAIGRFDHDAEKFNLKWG